MDVEVVTVGHKTVESKADEEKQRAPPPFFSVPCLTGKTFAYSGLRGVAALGVVCAHLFSGDGAKMFLNGWDEFAELGNVAVVFFFVLVTSPLATPLTEKQRPSDAKYVKWSENGIMVGIPWISIRWIKFLIRRAFRILPVYYIVLILAAAIPPLNKVYVDLRNLTPFTWKTAVNYIFFRDVNSIFWTIPPEFEYYFVVPIFIVLYEMAERKDKLGEWTMGIKANPSWYPYGLGSAEEEMQTHYRKGLHNRVLHTYYRFGRRAMLLVALSLFNFLVAPLFWASHGAFDYYHLPPYVRRFWLGSLAAFFYHMCSQYGYVIYDVKKPMHNQKLKGRIAKFFAIGGDLICWALLIWLLLSFPYWRRLILKQYVPATPKTWYADRMKDWPAVGSAVICFIVSATSRNGTFARTFLWIFFSFAGDVSFPLYLTHPCVIHLVLHKKIEGIDGVIFVFFVCMAISALFHYLLENPLGKIATTLSRWIQTNYFSKDPKPKVRGCSAEKSEEDDDDDDEEMKFNDGGREEKETPMSDAASQKSSSRTRYEPRIQSPAVASRGAPMVQIIPVKEERYPQPPLPESPTDGASSAVDAPRATTRNGDDIPIASGIGRGRPTTPM
ncbi:hypothetical protein BC832DRAFT_616077 [Gaertneriomyces semiglobifer]|nr:hypothetical protein BC832DRAFT_616077 [Gaertneriomyces semiglobifer]